MCTYVGVDRLITGPSWSMDGFPGPVPEPRRQTPEQTYLLTDVPGLEVVDSVESGITGDRQDRMRIYRREVRYAPKLLGTSQ